MFLCRTACFRCVCLGLGFFNFGKQLFQLCLKFKSSYIIQGEEINFKLNLRNPPNAVIKI